MSDTSPPAARPARGAAVLLLGAVALIVVVVGGIGLGARDIAPWDTVRILLHPDAQGYNAHVLWTERIPRTLLAVLVGAALGGSGMIMQALTMNPLADPGILGVEQGAALFVVCGVLFLDLNDAHDYFWLALAGAAVSALLVYTIGVRANTGSATLGLVLAGVAVAALTVSVITLLVVRDEAAFAQLRFWSVGQLTGRADVLDDILPFAAVGLLAALPLGRTLNVLGLGADTATGLGVNVARARLVGAAIGVLLCAAATAAVGPVAFVGLVGAHTARLLVGPDHRWSLPMSMVCGAVLLCAADIAGRLAGGDGEVQVGVMTAVIGTPFFVWLARRADLVRV
ncbi:FecCD family ABC transporter permease [Actinomadura hibisca]|uniref:FecCD family ABC transporter permease n=1 Tax=Actinomadura hibisca TaxID=68565 RepID=UPI00083155C2|nr:iron ABC transporter permease [Actinomadura hibisca]